MKKRKIKFSHRLFQNHIDEGEHILYIAHRHILVYKVSIIKPLFFGIMIPGFLYYLFQAGGMFFGIWMGIGIMALVYKFFDWYFDVWILTNNGVVDLEYNGLLDMSATRVDYHMIEGMSYTISGVLQTLFNYGDITVDKLGAQTSVVLKEASNPKKLERILMKYQEQFVFSRSVRDHNALKGMLAEMISYHVQQGKVDVPDND